MHMRVADKVAVDSGTGWGGAEISPSRYKNRLTNRENTYN